MRFTDTSIMPYGKHQGKVMCRVPANYLLWLYDNGRCSLLVRSYVEDNMDNLKKQIAEAERQKENHAKLRMMYK